MSAKQAQEQAAVEDWKPPAGLNNLDQYYWVRHKAMMQLYHNDEEAKAFEAAEELLLDTDLPLLYAARCHMVLSTDDDNPMYLQHAQEAVRVLDEDCRDLVEAISFPQKQYEEALRLRKLAEEEAAERAAALEAEESEEVEEDVEEVGEDVNEGEGVVGVETAEEAEAGAKA